MNKDIVIVRQEFQDGLINYINDAHLPSFMIAEAMEKILPIVKSNIEKEYETAYTSYLQALNAENKEQETLKGGDGAKTIINDNKSKEGGKR